MSLIDYSTEAGDEYHKARHTEILGNKRLIDGWSRYAAYTYFRDLSKESLILEIGAGTGINIAEVAKSHRVQAIEPSELARAHCKSLGIDAVEDLTSLPHGTTFDRILVRHVLEHVPEPRKFLVDVSNYLSQRGQLIIVLPAESAHAPIRKGDIDFHLYCWNRQTIANLLMATGYRVIGDQINWYNGRRLLLPLLRIFGAPTYALGMSILGRLRRSSEIMVIAERATCPP